MPAKKRFVVLIAAAVLCLICAGAVAVGVGYFFFRGTPAAPGLRLYRIDQVASTHPGYRKSTMTSGDEVYVNDYEESGLQLVNPAPSTVIALKGNFGHSNVCSIPGQPVTAYVAGDDGSEMEAFVVYRRSDHPPFDWRTAKFGEMTYLAPGMNNPGVKSVDPALIGEVLDLLRTGTPVSLPGISMADGASIPTIRMACDQLPGMFFCPVVRTGPDGTVYLAESLMFDLAAKPAQFQGKWIPVSANVLHWLQAR